jgi:integrase
MQLTNLTDRYVDSLKPEEGRRTEIRDGKVRGLILRISEKGTKSWSVLYRRKSDGRRRRCMCGSYPQITLADARVAALDILARVAKGEDPARDRKRATASHPRTLGDLAERYLKHAEASKRSGWQDRQMLEKDVLPLLGNEPLETIKRADIGDVLQRVVARGAPIQANRTLATIRGLYNWALGAGLIETTPCLGLKAPSSEQSRERALSADEIKIFWDGLPRAAMSWQSAQILRLCLVTAQRLGEVAGALKSELFLKEAEWRLPGHRVKNGCAHTVPLSPFAIELFAEAVARSPDCEFVFLSARTKRAITGQAVSKAVSRSLQLFGLDNFTPHDLRRTAATGMARLGIPRLIVDKCLNHVSADRSTIAGVYDRHAYEEEKRAAMQAWSVRLTGLIAERTNLFEEAA